MIGYLMDNNMLSRWYAQNPRVVAKVDALPENTPLFISAIVLGEIRYGYAVNSTTTASRKKSRDQFNKFMTVKFQSHALEITKHTSEPYAYLRSNLFDKFAPKSRKIKRTEQLSDPMTGHELGIDENDLWQAAQAIEHNLVFVTNDKVLRIREADVENPKRLKIEDWTK